jgi:hypothetical protein
MHAVTIRRMIVFGVCALGVGSLYLVPSVARSPEQIRSSGVNEEPTISPGAPRPGVSQQSASPSGNPDSVAGGGGAPTEPASGSQPSQTHAKARAHAADRPTRKAEPDETKENKDSEPPQPVAEIDASRITTRKLTINWPPATDNVGVIGYRIWLNGFEVATTAETRAQLRWFNDDSGQHVVQIRALDAAGNQSRSSPTLVVTRPSPEPTPSPTPEPSESPTPDDEQSEPGHPAAQSSDTPDTTPTEQKSTPEDGNR